MNLTWTSPHAQRHSHSGRKSTSIEPGFPAQKMPASAESTKRIWASSMDVMV